MTRPFVRPGYSPDRWAPAFPGQAVGTGELLAPQADPDAPRPGKAYEPAPASSHLHGWKVLTEPFFRTFYAESQGFARGTFLLQVAFRAKGKYPLTEYLYGFTSAAVVEEWAGKLRGAEHPGELVPLIQANCVKYARVR